MNNLILKNKFNKLASDSYRNNTVKYQWVYNLTSSNTEEFDELTFPSIKKRWQGTTQKGKIAGVAALVQHKMVGLILVEILPKTADVISFFVVPEYRHQGIGTQLMKYVEQALLKLKYPQIQLKYRVNNLTASTLEPILQRQGWETPTTDFILAKSDRDKILQAPWLHKYPLPDRFTVFPWVELTAADKKSILERKAYPNSLTPFSADPRLESLNSLGLRYQGEVVGWVINHRVADDTIRYSIMFVEPRFQRMGRGISLLIESIKLQIESGIFYGTLAVSNTNQPMLNWINRHFKKYSNLMSESRFSSKQLR